MPGQISGNLVDSGSNSTDLGPLSIGRICWSAAGVGRLGSKSAQPWPIPGNICADLGQTWLNTVRSRPKLVGADCGRPRPDSAEVGPRSIESGQSSADLAQTSDDVGPPLARRGPDLGQRWPGLGPTSTLSKDLGWRNPTCIPEFAWASLRNGDRLL